MPDHAAFMSEFIPHREALWAFIRAMVRDYHACEDVFQQVSTILWEQFEGYEPGTSFLAWARAIALNKIRHAWRTDKRLVNLSPESFDVLARAAERVQGTERDRSTDGLAALRQCIQALSSSARDMVTMRFDGSSSLRDLADRWKTTIGGISMRLTRIRRELQRCVSKRLVAGES